MKESDLEKERTVMMKTCTKCGETKPSTEFHKAGKRKGRRKSCKLCDKARRAEFDAMTPQQRSVARIKAREEREIRWQRISAAIAARREATA